MTHMHTFVLRATCCLVCAVLAGSEAIDVLTDSSIADRRLADSEELDSHWLDDPRCECCGNAGGEPLQNLYKTEVHKNCFRGGELRNDWRLEHILAQTVDGTLTVSGAAQKMICVSHLCRGSITKFWSEVHSCALSGYWKTVAMALATAKSECHQLQHQKEAGSSRWMSRVRAVFNGVDTSDEGAMLRAEGAAEKSAIEALATPPHGIDVGSNQFEVKCSSMPPFNGKLGRDSVEIQTTPAPSKNCVQVTSTWPADGERGVAADLADIVLHFDRCIRARSGTMLLLRPSRLPDVTSKDLQLRLRSTSDQPGKTLVFPMVSSAPLGKNKKYTMRLDGGEVTSCEGDQPICTDVNVTFYTVETQPAVLKTDLMADRWLRSIFDLPVEPYPDARFTLHFRQARMPDNKDREVKDLVVTAPLQKSEHFFMETEERMETNGGNQPFVNSGKPRTRCQYSLKPVHPDAQRCDDRHVMEVDLCDFYECEGSRLPCDIEVKATYSAGIAVRYETSVPNLKGVSLTTSRKCAPPFLVTPTKWPAEQPRLQIEWSQPVNIGDATRKFSVCHLDTPDMKCPVDKVAIGDSMVKPCTGPGGDCAIWSLDVGAGGRPSCGALSVEVEAGAVVSVDEHEEKLQNLQSKSRVEAINMCPRWNHDLGNNCFFLQGEEDNSQKQNLKADLDRVHLAYQVMKDTAYFFKRLESKSFLPRCIFMPAMDEQLDSEQGKILFDYVNLGGQLYIAGGTENVNSVADIFSLHLDAAPAGDHQVQTQPPPSPEMVTGNGMPIVLPVLSDLSYVKLANMTSFRSGEEVIVNGIYSSGHVAPTDGSFGFGVFEIGVGNGFAEYMAFDWKEDDASAREPWGRLLTALVNINFGRWAPPPPLPPPERLRRLSDTLIGPGRELSECPAGSLSPPQNNAQDFECTFTHLCPENTNEGASGPQSCQEARKHLSAMVSSEQLPFFARMKSRCINLKLKHFSPALVVKIPSPCPNEAVIDEAIGEMKAACGFGFGPDASVLDVEIVKSQHGVEALSRGVRSAICQQSLCRGRVARLHELMQGCPTTAGFKGQRARLANMLFTTAESCVHAGGAPLNVRNSLIATRVSGISPAEHDALARIVRDAVEEKLGMDAGGGIPRENAIVEITAYLSGVELAHKIEQDQSQITVKVDPVYPAEDIWVRAMGSKKPSATPEGQDSVAFVPDGLPGGACQSCSVRNLQVVAVQPALGAKGVNPRGVIRIFFDDAIVVDNPAAKIRIFPADLEDVCSSASRDQYYPFETGIGNIRAAADKLHATRRTPGVPISALCQEFTMSHSSVHVGDEMIQITPLYPFMRDSKIIVRVSPWAVRAAAVRPEERYAARWTGWLNTSTSRDEFTFRTSSPESSALVSVAVGCTDSVACSRIKGLLQFPGDALAERMECFLRWFRCSRDPSAPKICKHPEGLEWCNIAASSWDDLRPSLPPVDADATSASAEKFVAMKGVPVEMKSMAHKSFAGPWYVIAVGIVACVLSGLAAFRAAQWLVDKYRESREFDPHVMQTTWHLPYFILLVVLLLPCLVASWCAVFCPAWYHFAAALQGEGEESKAGTPGVLAHGLRIAMAESALERLKLQITWGAIVSVSACSAVNAFLAFAVIAKYHYSFIDLGQLTAVLACCLAWAGILGGACNWITSTSPTAHEREFGRELKFEAAVLAICLNASFSMIWTIILTPLFSGLAVLSVDGLGAILRHYLRFRWKQAWYWRDEHGVIGRWDQWILHVREMQLLHGFRASFSGGRSFDDGVLTIKIYTTDAPFSVISSRSFPVRALGKDGDTNSFEGDNMCININTWKSILVVDVVHQRADSNGAHPDRIAGAMWDPWDAILLEKCFTNWEICNPHNGRDVLWDFQALMDTDGLPQEGVYQEYRLNLSPSNGLFSFQVTHLGPKLFVPEREEPSDHPPTELYLGDTIFIGNAYSRKEPTLVQEFSSAFSAGVGAIDWIAGATALGVDAVELKGRGNDGSKTYGDTGLGTHISPHNLDPDEWITAVEQELQDPEAGKLGNSFSFFTSAGSVATFSGRSAVHSERFAAARGQQIRALSFTVSGELSGITVTEITDKEEGHAVVEIRYQCREDIEGIEFIYKHGREEAYGSRLTQAKSFKLDHDDYLIAVSQEVSGATSGRKDLGHSMLFYTSKGKVLPMVGQLSRRDVSAKGAEPGSQIVGLRFYNDRLEGVDNLPARAWRHSA